MSTDVDSLCHRTSMLCSSRWRPRIHPCIQQSFVPFVLTEAGLLKLLSRTRKLSLCGFILWNFCLAQSVHMSIFLHIPVCFCYYGYVVYFEVGHCDTCRIAIFVRLTRYVGPDWFNIKVRIKLFLNIPFDVRKQLCWE